MTLPASGNPISLLDIQNEFGGTNPIGIDEYYENGGLVPSGQGVPTSGTIAFSDFYGKSNIFQFTSPSNTILYNVNLRQTLINNGWNQAAYVIYTIPATTYITSTTTSTPALSVSGGYPNGLTIINNGYILGRGGNGGGSGAAGGMGGSGLYTTNSINVDNRGTIAGGGGGGGGGRFGDWVPPSGGGGSGGAPFGATGHGGYYSGGSDATLTTAGIVDSTTSFPDPRYGTDRWGLSGGPGGGWAQAGSAGSSSGAYGSGPWAGGNAGKSVEGYELINFINKGTILGDYSFSGSTPFGISTVGTNSIVGGGPLLSSYVVSGGNSPGLNGSLVDDGCWGRLDIRKNGYANFNWYLYGTNLMDNFYINSNGLISTSFSLVHQFTVGVPPYIKIFIDAQDRQTYNSWLNLTADSNNAFRIYYKTELYGQPGVYNTQELVFFNPQKTGGKMVLLIKFGGTGSYRLGGPRAIANANGSKYFDFSSYAGEGKNVLLIGDSTGSNWEALNGYIVDSSGNKVNN